MMKTMPSLSMNDMTYLSSRGDWNKSAITIMSKACPLSESSNYSGYRPAALIGWQPRESVSQKNKDQSLRLAVIQDRRHEISVAKNFPKF